MGFTRGFAFLIGVAQGLLADLFGSHTATPGFDLYDISPRMTNEEMKEAFAAVGAVLLHIETVRGFTSSVRSA